MHMVVIRRPRIVAEAAINVRRSRRSVMSYVEKHLIEGETIIYATGLHWIVLIRSFLLALLFRAPGVALLVLYEKQRGDGSAESTAMMAGGIAFLVVALICIIVGLIKRNATEMTVTDKGVIVK